MARRDNDYWRKRFEELQLALEEQGLSYYRFLEKDYQKAANNTLNDISRFYAILASGGMLNLSEAKKLLTNSELDDFKASIDAYIKFGKENGVDQRWITELENVKLRHRISRLQAMKICIRQHVEWLYYNELNDMNKVMGDIYSESYNRTAFEIAVGLGLLLPFKNLTEEVINEVVKTPWTPDGITLSERIWGKHRPALIHDLEKGLTQAIIRGESLDKFASYISKKYNVSKAQAKSLVRTESAYMTAVGQRDMYKEMNVKYYQIVATLDDRTSEICRYMDGKVFKTSEYEIGVTANPFHVNCRTTTTPYFENNITERAARDENGKTVFVKSDLTYKEWKKFVENK